MLRNLANQSWLINLNKLGQLTILLSLREGFIALMPYYVVMALTTLLTELLYAVSVQSPLAVLHPFFLSINQILVFLFPLAMVISVSYQLSGHLKIHGAFSAIFAVISFVSVSGYGANLLGIGAESSSGFNSLYAVLLSVICPYLLAGLVNIKSLQLAKGHLLSPFLQQHINLIVPASLGFFALLLLKLLFASAEFSLNLPSISFSNETLIIIRTFFVQLFWSVGIHGGNVYDSLFSSEFLSNSLPSGLTVKGFIDLFVFVGGNILGVIIACLWIGKRQKSQAVAKIALPFSLFNIGEIVIYGLPIACNPILILPWMLVIMMHCLVGLALVQLGWWQFTTPEVSWLTPVFINAWWSSGDWTLVLYQAVIITLDTLIFMPFIYVHDRLNNPEAQIHTLQGKLTINHQLQVKSEARYAFAQTDLMVKDMELSHAIQAVNEGELMLHYQPKVSSFDKQVKGYEALLRIRNKQGNIEGPWFIPTLGQNRLSPWIDEWVIEQVCQDLQKAYMQRLKPKVSLNLHPQTLGDYDVVSRLVAAAYDFPEQLEVEILETSLDMASPIAHQQLSRIRQAGLPIAIDDFGSGYSNLSRLFGFAPEVIKLDRSLLMAPVDERGHNSYQKLTAMCKGLGYQIVAEGVETEEQQDLVRQANVDLIQGWIYCRAMPWQQALNFQLA